MISQFARPAQKASSTPKVCSCPLPFSLLSPLQNVLRTQPHPFDYDLLLCVLLHGARHRLSFLCLYLSLSLVAYRRWARVSRRKSKILKIKKIQSLRKTQRCLSCLYACFGFVGLFAFCEVRGRSEREVEAREGTARETEREIDRAAKPDNGNSPPTLTARSASESTRVKSSKGAKRLPGVFA